MKALHDFIEQYAERGNCECGRCVDADSDPKQPNGHTADMVFFKVAAKNNPDPKKLRELIRANVKGEYCNIDLFDDKEHSYIEIGGWIGDQGSALILMGLGAVLGLWNLLSPITILRLERDNPITLRLVGNGMLTIKNN
jgi:hypothetical protein